MESCGKKSGYKRGKRPDRQLSKKIASVQITVAANRRYADVFLVGKEPVRLQLDLRSDIMVVTVRTREKMDSSDLQKNVAKVMTRMGSPMNIIGHWRTNFSWEDHSEQGLCHVSAELTKNLMRMDWMEQLPSIREALFKFVTDEISKKKRSGSKTEKCQRILQIDFKGGKWHSSTTILELITRERFNLDKQIRFKPGSRKEIARYEIKRDDFET